MPDIGPGAPKDPPSVNKFPPFLGDQNLWLNVCGACGMALAWDEAQAAHRALTVEEQAAYDAWR